MREISAQGKWHVSDQIALFKITAGIIRQKIKRKCEN